MATNHLQSVPQTNSWENWHEDEIIEELHQHRAEIAERFEYDLERVFDYYFSTPVDSTAARAQLRPVVPRRQGLNKQPPK